MRAAAGTVRVIAIDNAAGRFAGGTDGAQARWLRDTMDNARDQGIPSVVVGSVPLNAGQNATPASDAADEIALLAGHASAYVATAGVDDPADRHFGGALAEGLATSPGAAAPLVLLQSATLGYAPTQASLYGPFAIGGDGRDAFRQTLPALMLVDVAIDRLDRSTGIAPVTATAETLLERPTLMTGLRSIPIGWAQSLQIVGATPSPQRYLIKTAPEAEPAPASPPAMAYAPQDQCKYWTECDNVVQGNVLFASSDQQVARFVAARRGTDEKNRRPEIVLDADGHVVDDPRGMFCPLTLGTTTVTATVMGQRIAAPVRVTPLPPFATGDAGNGKTHYEAVPIPPGTCGFPNFVKVKDEPKAVVAEKPTAKPRPAPTHEPAAKPKPKHHHPKPRPQPAAAATPLPAPPVPLPTVDPPAADHARPQVAPAAKPPAPTAPPAPPQGLSVQQAAAPQVSPFQAVQAQEERREEYAFEADSAAVAYAHPPSPLPWEIAGGVATLALIMAGGGLAGRARARRRAVVRATL